MQESNLNEILEVNQNHIVLLLYDLCGILPDEITNLLMLDPHSTGIKGESYKIGPPNKRIAKTHHYSFWEYEWKDKSNDSIGDLIEKFIKEIIIPKKDLLKRLISKCKIQLKIVQYYYDGCNPGYHFNEQVISILSELQASIDLDVYCLSDE